jgi:hypothetical protein
LQYESPLNRSVFTSKVYQKMRQFGSDFKGYKLHNSLVTYGFYGINMSDFLSKKEAPMKHVFVALTSLLCLQIQTVQARQYINFDEGGQIANYVTKYIAWKFSDERVVINGPCASACTIVLGAIPMDRICVTPRAKLGFHSAWSHKETIDGVEVKVKSFESTDWLWRMYPKPVQQWILVHGGLPPPSGMLFLEKEEIVKLFTPCSPDDLAMTQP